MSYYTGLNAGRKSVLKACSVYWSDWAEKVKLLSGVCTQSTVVFSQRPLKSAFRKQTCAIVTAGKKNTHTPKKRISYRDTLEWVYCTGFSDYVMTWISFILECYNVCVYPRERDDDGQRDFLSRERQISWRKCCERVKRKSHKQPQGQVTFAARHPVYSQTSSLEGSSLFLTFLTWSI